jgi:hypothetical protein
MRKAVATIFTIACIAISIATGFSQSLLTSRESGIYIEIESKLVTISSTVIDKGSPSGVMANAASLGFKGVDIKSKIAGAQSELRIRSANPEFLFRGDSFKPNEYALVKMETKDERRELKTGKVGMFGRVKSEMDKDAMIKTRFSKVEDGLWRVSPEKALKAGEYAFVLATAVPERVWSFGIE